MKSYAISEGLAQAILDYLVKQPYGEVYVLIGALKGLQEIPPAPLAVVPKPEEK